MRYAAGRRARPSLFLWQPGSKTQARDDPALLKAIRLQQRTETALFDLNIKFYSLFFFFLISFLEEREEWF